MPPTFLHIMGQRAKRAFNLAAFFEVPFGVVPVGPQASDLFGDGREASSRGHSPSPQIVSLKSEGAAGDQPASLYVV